VETVSISHFRRAAIENWNKLDLTVRQINFSRYEWKITAVDEMFLYALIQLDNVLHHETL
jgi:hypothetical protein